MKKWLCIVCGWVYDEAKGWPADGIAPGTRWEDIPEDWLCPDCQVTKADFEMLDITDDEEESIGNAIVDNTIEPVVIIGSGHAGYQLASALRSQSPDLSITLFTADDGSVYSKPALSNALALGKSCDDLVRESALSWERRLDIRVYAHTRINKIDRSQKRLYTTIGEYIYGRLVLATGATPIIIPVEGEQSALFSVNDLADYKQFRSNLTDKKHITILGDGLIGCEFANDLAAHGMAVTVVGLGKWPMERLIPQQLGSGLQQALSGIGVEWKLENSIRSVQSLGDRYQLALQDGQCIETDLVLSAVGLRPNIALAQTAGLITGRGIQTDLNHQSSDPAIYALGDCAEVDGEWAPYINPINQALPALVNSLLGKPTPASLKATPIIVKTPVLPLSILPGIGAGDWRVEQYGQDLAAGFYDKAGNLTGFALLGTTLQSQRNQWLEKITLNKTAA
ncbi:FAD-dependent oxidoreductase [Psychrobacter fozii]|uniref:Rubredoxin-NAD+ reductase n=1 Tax=Psychrobacter fozii TaxID=198480 RepID=A0A2V4VB93_9GAMM|nr:FAD-dependent oxidoreductase [Psychrobacter fozii]PYE39568.1 rubredoxin-NAD+ reductase [Psychrobacter fozii]